VVGPAASLAVLRTAPIQVAAHRGASLRNPENTVPAIKNAVKLGADWLELDVRALKADPDPDGEGPLTAQEHFVLMHDPTFLRTTDIERVFPGRRSLGTAQFTWPEVQRLDAGSWKSARFTGARVPDLKAALDAIDQAEQQYDRQVRLVLEFKGDRPSMFAALYDQVKALRPDWISAAGHDDKLVFMSFDYASVFETVRADHAADGVEFAGVMDSTADRALDWLSQMHVHSSLASAGNLQRVHSTVPQAAVYTVDSASSILSAATAGADIVTTDDVETARSALLR
jgi:glycerophosphoryl diester phosphodiesterase